MCSAWLQCFLQRPLNHKPYNLYKPYTAYKPYKSSKPYKPYKLKDWKAHLKQCMVAWQCSVLWVILPDSRDSISGRRANRLRGGPEGGSECSQQASETGKLGATRESGRQPHHSEALLLALAKAVVRQDEELKTLKQDHSIVMWMKPGEYGGLHCLYNTAKAFKQKHKLFKPETP